MDYIYREFTQGRGLFYDGHKENAIFANSSQGAHERWEENEHLMQEVELIIPPKQKIKFMIPIVEGGEVDHDFFDYIYDERTDSIMSGVLEILMKHYTPIVGGKFMKGSIDFGGKYDSENLEKFQSMKDIIMGRFRVTPVKIPVGEDKYYDWHIGTDVYNVEYEYKGKTYKTNHFGLYASNFRKYMFPDADMYDFYGGHSMQYWQRLNGFKSGYVTYTNACRGLGKSIINNNWAVVDLLRERVFRGERSKDHLVLYYGATKEEVSEILNYSRSMLTQLLDSAGAGAVADSMIKLPASKNTLTFCDGKEKRRLRGVSENQSARGSRPSFVIIDELAKYKKGDEIMSEVLGFGKCPISIISTVKEDTARNIFYENWANAFKKMRKYEETMFDIVHDIRWKYGFGDCKSPEDYLALAKKGVFNDARAELFSRRTIAGMKFTIDDGEIKTETEKDIEIQAFLDSHGYGALMAEFYGVVLDDRSVFRTSGCIQDVMPHHENNKYSMIYFSYDEADEYDHPAIVVGGIYKGKLYILDSVRLTADLSNRYTQMKDLYEKRRRQSVGGLTKIVVDVNRGVTIREKVIDELGKLDIPFAFTRSSAKEDFKISDGKHIVNKGRLVKLLQGEYIAKGKVIINSALMNEGGLIEEMSNFVDKGNGKFEGDKKTKDDQVSALLQVVYAAHIGFFAGVRRMGYDMLTEEEIRRRNIDAHMAMQKYKKDLKKTNSVLGRYF